VYLVHLNLPEDDPNRIEQLYDGLDAHTLWFTRSGKYVAWSNYKHVWVRKPNDFAQAPITITIPGKKLVQGFSWHPDDENRIVIAAGTEIWIYDVARADLRLFYQMAPEEEQAGMFVAEPRWKGNDIIFTLFEDREILKVLREAGAGGGR
jgi:hypothetical protein